MQRLAWVLLVSSFPVVAEPVTGPRVSDAEIKRLDSGEVLTRELAPTGGKGVGAVAFGVVEAPSDEVWPVLRDCQHFWQFMPRTKKSWVKDEPGVGPICHVELKLPFPLPDLWSDTTAIVREEPKGHYSRVWTMVRGTYHRNDGSWTLIPWGDGSKSLVVYTVDSDPKMAVPDPLIRMGQAGSLPEVVTQIRKRVQQLRASAPTAAATGK